MNKEKSSQIIFTFVSHRIRKSLREFDGSSKKLKIIFDDFLGRPDWFELTMRFCINRGNIEFNPSNSVLLSRVADLMAKDKNTNVSELLNLRELMEKSLEGIDSGSWLDLLVALKLCQDLLPAEDSSLLLQKILQCVVERLSPSFSSPYICFSEQFSLQSSCNVRSSTFSSTRYSCSNSSWWFEDLLFLNVDLLSKMATIMVSQKFDHIIIRKFLVFYQKAKFPGAELNEKCHIVEMMINLLYLLDSTSLSCKCLFNILHIATRLKLSEYYRNKLISMVGPRLEQANLDDLLLRAPCDGGCVYDIDFVQKLVKSFLFEEKGHRPSVRSKRVANLIDFYLTEVAADSHLRPSEFSMLVRMLPDSARESHDRLYRLIDLYLEVHTGLQEEEKIEICSVLSYQKLSSEALKGLSENPKFPREMVVQAFLYRYSMVKNHQGHKQRLVNFSNIQKASKNRTEKSCMANVIFYTNQLFTSEASEDSKGLKFQTDLTELGKIRHTTKSSFFLPKLCSEV